jgi:hypothetical protein
LEEECKVKEYLSNKISTIKPLLEQLEKGKPAYIIEETCMDILTKELRPSKFNYISNILEEEFEDTYQLLLESGTLKFEIINLINHCQSVFQAIEFTEEDDNPLLNYAVTGAISEYLEKEQEKM